MIQLIGLIVATYAVARLFQVPLEGPAADKQSWASTLLGLVSIVGIITIGVLSLALLSAGIEMPKVP